MLRKSVSARKPRAGAISVLSTITIFLLSVAAGGLLLTAYRDWVQDRCRRVNTELIRWKYVGGGPPPRPSDARWHAEHCWHYNPR